MGGDSQQGGSLLAGLTKTSDVPVLEIPDAAVNDAKVMGGGGAREIAPLDQPDRKSSLRGVPRCTRAEDPAANDQEIELGADQGCEISPQGCLSIVAAFFVCGVSSEWGGGAGWMSGTGQAGSRGHSTAGRWCKYQATRRLAGAPPRGARLAGAGGEG